MSKVQLAGAFAKKVLPKTGTTIEKGIYDVTKEYNAFTGNHFGSWINTSEKGVTKLITYGENTPMAQIGIDQVAISSFPKSGEKQFVYLRDGKSINQIYTQNGQVIGYQQGGAIHCHKHPEGKTFQGLLKPFIDALKQLK